MNRRRDFLADAIETANKIYWKTGEDGMDETRYNEYCEELYELDPANEVFTKIYSESLNLSSKVKHETPIVEFAKGV